MDGLASMFETALVLLDKVDTLVTVAGMLVTVVGMVVSVICTLMTLLFVYKAKSYKELVLRGHTIDKFLKKAEDVQKKCKTIIPAGGNSQAGRGATTQNRLNQRVIAEIQHFSDSLEQYNHRIPGGKCKEFSGNLRKQIQNYLNAQNPNSQYEIAEKMDEKINQIIAFFRQQKDKMK